MPEPHNCPLRILMLEEESFTCGRVLLPRLLEHGFAVEAHASLAALEEATQYFHPDVVLLGTDLSNADAFSVVRQLRRQRPDIGVVMLIDPPGSTDCVRGLMQGADACLSTPVDVALLAANLYSLGRRLQQAQLHRGRTPPAPRQWELDEHAWRLSAPCGNSTSLTRSELCLLQNLLQAPGCVVSRERLIQALTPDVFHFDPHRLDSLIHRLRRKVHKYCGRPLPLRTVHGEGYLLTP
ncbi:TPA: response regulator transcription factor [Stenotrophomonas maltophilia]